MKLISVVVPCFNEEENVVTLHERLKKIFSSLPTYKYEIIFIDNDSKDNTRNVLRKIAARDRNVKLIFNARNFGPVKSPYYALLQANGDAIIQMAADLQEPPELIVDFIREWENGCKVVIGVKNKSKENPIMFFIRKIYYNLIKKFSESEQIRNFTGFGLYDRSFIDIIRTIDDANPYFRGLISEIGFEYSEINYVQPKRLHGKTKLNFYTLYDVAMSGFVNHSKLPLRLSIFVGFFVAIISLLVALVYFIYKLIYWDTFSAGTAPLVIGLFFFSSIQLIFIGIIGEYIGAIHTQVRKRPLVIEKERVNFEEGETINDSKKN